MKKLIVLLAFAYFFSSFAMEEKQTEKVVNGNKLLNDLNEKLEKDIEHSRANGIYRDLADQNELADIDRRISRSTSEAEKVALINQRTQILKNQAEIKQQLYKNGEYYFKEKAAATKAQAKVIEEHERAQEKKERTKIKAAENRQAYVDAARETVNEKINFIKQNPKLIIGLAGGISAGFFAAKHGTQILAEIIKHWYQAPTLAQETSLKPLKDKFLNLFFKQQLSENNIDAVILEPKLLKQVTRLAASVKNTVANGANFTNILFYGLPGTGKTMVAKKIARNSGLEYIYFAASSLDQFSLEEALIKLTELFEYAKKSSKKLMLIIDEAEILFANRDNKLSEKTQKMLNLILTYTGTENNNYLVVALTNRPED